MNFNELWVEKYRPKTLDDLILSKENREFFEIIAKSEDKNIPHMLFSSPPGAGKTSLAHIIVNDILKCQYLYLNASDQNSVDVVRGLITNFIQTKSIDGKIKVVILDEADTLTTIGTNGSSAQQALRNIMEEYQKYARFILTCNYPEKILEALVSRVQTFTFKPEISDYIKKCVTILKSEGIKIPEEERGKLKKLIHSCYPDFRRCINNLQKFSITGVLKIENYDSFETFSNDIYQKIKSKVDIFEIRKYIIENEKSFNSDYINVLRNLFNTVYIDSIDEEKKKHMLLLIAEHMQNHVIVMDKEINFFVCLIKMDEVVN